MEFTIEELPSSKMETSSQKDPCFRLWWAKLCSFKERGTRRFKLWLYRGNKLSIWGELWGFVGLLGVVVLGIVGQDIWHHWQQRAHFTKLQQDIRAQTVIHQQLQSSIAPINRYLYDHWLQEREDNLQSLLKLLTLIASTFDEISLLEIKKSVNDPSFYLEGVAASYDLIYQLEEWLLAHHWHITIKSLSERELPSFRLRFTPSYYEYADNG